MATKLEPPPLTNTILDRWLPRLYRFFVSGGEVADLTDGGDTSLHFHASDRARANHTGTQAASTVVLDRIGSSTYSTVQDLQNIFHSAGWVSGGNITDNGNGTVAVTAGSGAIRATDSNTAPILFFDFAANASVSLTNLATNWIYVDYNAGSPAVTASTVEPTEYNTKIKLAAIYRNGTELHINQEVRYSIGDHAAKMVQQMQETMPYAHVTGGMMGETGTRNLSVTAGIFWNGLSRFSTSAINTAVSGTFGTFHRNGAGGWTEVTGQTQINNTNFDDGDGTLGTLTANRYTNRWVFMATDSDIHIVYGQAQYVLLADAQEENMPGSLPPELTTDSFLLGRIIVRQGVATLVQIDSAFDRMFNTASVNNHNDLAGLQGGAASEYYHLTAAEYAGTGTGNFVRATSPVLAANSASPALTITQTGTGNALVVEDSTSPDSSPFAIDANGRVLIGTTTATGDSFFQIAGAISTAAPFRLATVNTSIAPTQANFSGEINPSGTIQAIGINVGATVALGGASLTNLYGIVFDLQLTSAIAPTNWQQLFTRLNLGATSSGTIANFRGVLVSTPNVIAGSTTVVTNYFGVEVQSISSSHTLAAAYRGSLSASAGRWNCLMDGTASNGFAGNSSFGKLTAPTCSVDATSIASSIVTNAASTYTVLTTDSTIVQTTAASVYTLPSAASFPGRILHLVTQFAGTVTSASSNVVPIAGGAAGTAILAATAGKFATLQSNGTNWLTIAAN